MLNLCFSGRLAGLEQGLAIMAEELGFALSSDGIPVEVSESEKIRISCDGKKAQIAFARRHQFFRALSILIPRLKRGEVFSHEEEVLFTTNGTMFDVSRNAVLTVDTMKYMLRKMALMGLNMAMLYTEDTYEVPEYPYFGYLRGRYTEAELRELDDYADLFGIEMIPCIQTLGHLTEALKWDEMAGFRDTPDVLLCDDEKTYELIDRMIAAASRPFRSRRIHIGMDEAHSLGLGHYIEKNGYVDGFEIINRHLTRVCEILKKYGLTPMIWSDMYFRLASQVDDYYTEKPIPQEVLDLVPSEVQLVYWDYYYLEEEHYRSFLKKHMQFHNPILFAGGLWTSVSPVVHYGSVFRKSIPALNQCRACGIKEVFCTMWGNNGAEADLRTSLLGMQLYAEYGYSGEVTMEKVTDRFAECVFADADDLMALSLLDVISDPAKDGLPPLENSNFVKYLLYQDVLLGLFDKDTEGIDFTSHYAALAERFAEAARKEGPLSDIFACYQTMADFLAIKADMGKHILAAYKNKDNDTLRRIAEEDIPLALTRLQTFRDARCALWLSSCKPFGYEVLDIRMGGIAARLQTARKRLLAFLDGSCPNLPELEEERLPLVRYTKENGETGFRRHNKWSRIVSACPI